MEMLIATVNMKSTYNTGREVRAELIDFYSTLNTSAETCSQHMDSDCTKIKTYTSFIEHVLPRIPIMTTSLIENGFTLNSGNALHNKHVGEKSQLQGFKEKEQEKKLTQITSMKVQQFSSANDKTQEDNCVEMYLESELQDSLNPDDYFRKDRTSCLGNELTLVQNIVCDGNGCNSFSIYAEPSTNMYYSISTQKDSGKLDKSTQCDSGIDSNYSTKSDSVQSDSSNKSKSVLLHSLLGSISSESISSPTKCTEESELTLPEDQGKFCFSAHLDLYESDSLRRCYCLSDSEQSWTSSQKESNHQTQSETSLLERSGETVYVTPKILVDNETESSYFRNCLSLHVHGQRQSKIQAVISDQTSDSAFKTGHGTGRFNMADTELAVHEKPHLRPRQINVQNRVYYWRQEMQLYFTLMTTLSIFGSLKWLFQLRPVTIQALQRLQSNLIYPFTNLNEFFSYQSRDSPTNAEECMTVEWMRLQTFQNYPIAASGSPIRLAREGFYYTGQGTQTKCFCCGVTHGEWNYFDNPREVHRRLSPNCPFLNGRQEEHRNIPMSPDGSRDVGRADRDSIPSPSLLVAALPGSATSQSRGDESRSVSKTTDEDDRIGQHHKSGSGETTPRVPSHPVEESAQSEADNRPKFPEHVSLPSRIATFSHGWPPYLDQTPQQMAEAGFFFTGNQDYTRCYQCGGGLRNWEPGDNPWIEHCRWYPTCPHVQKGKGQRFVNAVLKKQAELLATQRAESRRKAQYGIGNTDPLETLAAITLLEMGYPRDTVRNSILILRRQREPGAEITAQEVLDFIWKEEDIERQRQEEEASRPRRPGDAQPPALPSLMERLNLGGSPVVTQAAVQQSASVTTTTSAVTTAATTTTSVTMAISSISETSNTTSVSTSSLTSGSTQSAGTTSQGQRQDDVQGHGDGKNGNKSGGSLQKDAIHHPEVSEGGVERDSTAQDEGTSGAEGGQSGRLGANAQAIAAAIEDEEFHSLDSEEMENKDYGELEEENKKLKEQTTCKICMENQIQIIFLPCGHLVCCETCAPAFRKCPICRKRIQQSVKTYL